MMYPVKRKWQSESTVVNGSHYPVKRVQGQGGSVHRNQCTTIEPRDRGFKCSEASNNPPSSNVIKDTVVPSRNGFQCSETKSNTQPSEITRSKKNNKQKATQPSIVDERCTKARSDFSKITGLTLHLPPDDEINNENACMILFESCKRSSVEIKIDSTRSSFNGCLHKEKCRCVWTSHLWVKGIVVATVQHIIIKQSKLNVCEDGLNILRQFQPIRRKTPQEIHIKDGEVIPGLVLYFENPEQEQLKTPGEQRKPWSEVLDYSCRKCNLTLTWFEDNDFVLCTRLSALVLIDSKPVAVGYHFQRMPNARGNTAVHAIKLLRRNHPVVYKSSPDLHLREAQLLDPASKNSSNEEEKTEIPGFKVYLEYPGEENEISIAKIIYRCATKNNRQLVYVDKGVEYERSAERNKKSTHHIDLLCEDIFLARGSGITAWEARNDAYSNALQRLMKTQYVVYANSRRQSIGEIVKELVADQHKWRAKFTVTSEFTCQRYYSMLELVRAQHQFVDNELIAKYIDLYRDI